MHSLYSRQHSWYYNLPVACLTLLAFVGISYAALVEAPVRQPGQAITNTARPDELRLMAYYMGYSNYNPRYYMPSSIDASKLTHLIYGFIDINRTLVLASGDEWTDLKAPLNYRKPWNCPCCAFGNIAELMDIKKRHPHLRTMISVGGWDYSLYISDAVSAEALRRQLAKSVVSWVVDYGLDGVDWDWEFPVIGGKWGSSRRPDDIENLMHFFELLREEFTNLNVNKEYLISLTLSYDVGGYFDMYDWARLQRSINWVKIMSYEMVWGAQRTRHTSPLYSRTPSDPSIHKLLQRLRQTGLPNSFFVFGVAPYSRRYAGVSSSSPTSNGYNEVYSDYNYLTVAYSDILKELNTEGTLAKRYWDDTAKAVWSWNPATRVMASYDDPQSVTAKAQYIRDNGYGGLFFFDISYDSGIPTEMSVLSAAHQVLKNDPRFSTSNDVLCVKSPKYCNIDCDPTPPPLINRTQLATVHEQCHQPGMVAFMFNGGPDDFYTNDALDTFKNYSLTGTFAVLPGTLTDGRKASVVFQSATAGHYVTHAGFSWNQYTSLSIDAIQQDMLRADGMLGQILGKRPVTVALPYRAIDDRILMALGREGYVVIHPNLDARETQVENAGSSTQDGALILDDESIYQRVFKRVQDAFHVADQSGGKARYSWIIGQSDRFNGSVAALSELILMAKDYGYRPVSLSECLGPYFAGYRSVSTSMMSDLVGDFRTPFRRQCARPGTIALGFHSSPSKNLEQLLDFLLERRVRATFFIVGSQVIDSFFYRHLIQRAYREGHTIAHHSFSFDNYYHMSDMEIRADLKLNDRLLSDLLGQAPKWVLTPYRAMDTRIRNLLTQHGYEIAMPDIVPVEYILQTERRNSSSTSALMDEFLLRSEIPLLFSRSLKNKFDNPSVSSFLSLQSEHHFDPFLQDRLLKIIKASGYSTVSLEECYADLPGWDSSYRPHQTECGDGFCEYDRGESCFNCRGECRCNMGETTRSTTNNTAPILGDAFENRGIFDIFSGKFDATQTFMLWMSVFSVIGIGLVTTIIGIRVRTHYDEQREKRKILSMQPAASLAQPVGASGLAAAEMAARPAVSIPPPPPPPEPTPALIPASPTILTAGLQLHANLREVRRRSLKPMSPKAATSMPMPLRQTHNSEMRDVEAGGVNLPSPLKHLPPPLVAAKTRQLPPPPPPPALNTAAKAETTSRPLPMPNAAPPPALLPPMPPARSATTTATTAPAPPQRLPVLPPPPPVAALPPKPLSAVPTTLPPTQSKPSVGKLALNKDTPVIRTGAPPPPPPKSRQTPPK